MPPISGEEEKEWESDLKSILSWTVINTGNEKQKQSCKSNEHEQLKNQKVDKRVEKTKKHKTQMINDLKNTNKGSMREAVRSFSEVRARIWELAQEAANLKGSCRLQTWEQPVRWLLSYIWGSEQGFEKKWKRRIE